MQPRKKHRFVLIPLLALAFVFCTVSAWADVTVSTDIGLREALDGSENIIIISGDVVVEAPFVIDRAVILSGDEGALVLSAGFDIEAGNFNTDMITVEADGVVMSNLAIGVESNDQWLGGDLWSLITVTQDGGLSVNSCNLYGCPPETTRTEFDEESTGDLRFALIAVHVEGGAFEATNSEFNSLYLSGVLLDSGTSNASVTDCRFDDCAIGIMTAHDTEAAYDNQEQTITGLRIEDNLFSGGEFGVVLLPNTVSTDITGNDFLNLVSDNVAYAGIVALPVGLSDLRGLAEAAYMIEDDDLDLETGYLLVKDHLIFPDSANLVGDLAISSNDFTEDLELGIGLAGCTHNITVTGNLFGTLITPGPNVCGTLVTGFPGQILGKLLDLLFAEEASLVEESDFPDYPADVTLTSNTFRGCAIGAAVGLNASAVFNAKGEGDKNACFQGNTVGLVLLNGPGTVTVQGQDFTDNIVGIADCGYEEILGCLEMEEALAAFPPTAEFVEASGSTLVVQNNDFNLPPKGEGILVLNGKVRSNIRFNTFTHDFNLVAVASLSKAAWDLAVELDSRYDLGLSEESFDYLDDLQDYTAVRVGNTMLDCAPDRVSITENFFDTDGIASGEWTHILFDLPADATGDYCVNLNTFVELEDLASPDSYAVVVSGDLTIDGTHNLWLAEEPVPLSADAVTDRNYVLGDLTVDPVFDDQSLADMPEDLNLTSEDVDGGILFSGSVNGNSFSVQIPEGFDSRDLFIRTVGESEAFNAFTDAELDGIDLPGLFHMPLDIQIEGLEENQTLIFRFRNAGGITPEDLIVKTTTPNGAYEWYTPFQNPAPEGYDGSMAYVSDDGEWIVLEIVEGTEAELVGSVTVAGEPERPSSGGGSSGSCNVGGFAPGALLLLLPLVGILRK